MMDMNSSDPPKSLPHGKGVFGGVAGCFSGNKDKLGLDM